MKTVIDIDVELLEQAKVLLGGASMKDAVHTALRELVDSSKNKEAAALARQKRLEFLEYWKTDPHPELRDREFRRQAWQ